MTQIPPISPRPSLTGRLETRSTLEARIGRRWALKSPQQGKALAPRLALSLHRRRFALRFQAGNEATPDSSCRGEAAAPARGALAGASKRGSTRGPGLCSREWCRKAAGPRLGCGHVEEATDAPEVPTSWCNPLQRTPHPVAQPWPRCASLPSQRGAEPPRGRSQPRRTRWHAAPEPEGAEPAPATRPCTLGTAHGGVPKAWGALGSSTAPPRPCLCPHSSAAGTAAEPRSSCAHSPPRITGGGKWPPTCPKPGVSPGWLWCSWRSPSLTLGLKHLNSPRGPSGWPQKSLPPKVGFRLLLGAPEAGAREAPSLCPAGQRTPSPRAQTGQSCHPCRGHGCPQNQGGPGQRDSKARPPVSSAAADPTGEGSREGSLVPTPSSTAAPAPVSCGHSRLGTANPSALVHLRDPQHANAHRRPPGGTGAGTAWALWGRGAGQGWVQEHPGAPHPQAPAPPEPHSSLLPPAPEQPPGSMASPAPPVNPCSPKLRIPGALPDSSEFLRRYFYPAVAIEMSDPLAVMQPLSEALHHRLPPAASHARGRRTLFWAEPAVAGGCQPCRTARPGRDEGSSRERG